MGCGSSAAVRLGPRSHSPRPFVLSVGCRTRIVYHAVGLEGHPDNVAACWHGRPDDCSNSHQLAIISLPPPPGAALLILRKHRWGPPTNSRFHAAPSYRRRTCHEVQCAIVVNRGFCTARRSDAPGNLRPSAPTYRAELCPLLPPPRPVAPLSGNHGGDVRLNVIGAGPARSFSSPNYPGNNLVGNDSGACAPVCP